MKLFYTLCFLLCCNIVFSQQFPSVSSVNSEQNYPQNNNANSGYCALDGLRQSLAGRSDGNSYSETEMDELIYSRTQSRNGRSGPVYIPVVVHIIHNNGAENISDQMVLQGIQDMNDAFANAGSYYSPDGFDMGIRFCLALQDPNGLPTNGITRNVSTLTNVTADNGQDLQLKNIIRWDPLRYVNIWLVKEITSASMGAGVAGYAFLPNAHGAPEDGIVNEARWFGNNTDDSKIHIHEMGHYLGLYHTFEGGCTNNNCQTDGDKVCDTPPDGTSAPYACNSIPNTCTTDENDTSPNNPFRSVALGGLGDQNDLMEDFMDYGLSSCQKLFTDGQGERMRAALQSIRFSLLESRVCESSCGIGNVGIDTTDVVNISAGTLFQVGNHFTATVPVTFEWVFNGSVISTSANLSHTFTNANIGQHYLYLNWINAADDCSMKDSILINVSCNPPASFTFSPYIIEPSVSVTFNGQNPLATSYAWYLNNQQVGSSSTYTHTFANSGVNHIYLVTGNGQCVDTSTVQYLGVGACGSGENNHWIMGGGSGNHIDFSNGTPVVSPVPNNGANPLATIEGVATISDRNGNLLFYSDGDHLYNRNHEQFFYGMGAGSSSAQGVLIVPDPGDSQSYYVFTAENFGGMAYQTGRGLSYLKVNMNMNGGLGGVSSQYITLLSRCGEKLSATKHCNGTDVWVVAHGFNDRKFYSYLITAAGLQTPVITEVGTSQAGNNSIGGQAIGMHKFSPDGNKLFSSTPTLYFSELFDFDNSTGIMSNPYNFPVPAHIYSAEFSPDGTKLYYAKNESNIIYGCDISSGNAQAITSSITTVGVSGVPNHVGTFQIAPDGKIYIARNGDMFIDVIHNPNGPLTNCGFETEILRMPNASLYGLQNILVSPKYTGPQILGPVNVCLGNNDVRYKVGCGDNTWEYRGHNAFSTISNKEVSINFSVAGVDTLICHRNNTCGGPGSDTLYIRVGGNFAHLGNDTSICSSGSLILSPGSGFLSTLWSTGANTSNITVSQAGTYWVQVTGLGGCIDRDTIQVTSFNSPFDVPDAATIRICGVPNVTTHTITAAQGNFTHVWNGTQSIGNSFTANLPSAITRVPITYYNNQGCADRDTFVIEKVTTFPTLNLGNDTLICPGELVVLNIDSPERFESFRWSDGSNGESFTVYQPGIYWVQYQDSICHRRETDVITVGYHPVAAINLPPYPVTICSNASYQLDAGTGYSNFTWQDGSTGRYHQVTQPGIYWVEAQAVCETVRDSATINWIDDSIYQINFPDTITLCSNSLPYSLHGSATGNLNNYQWSTGSNSVNIIVQSGGTYSLTANYVCGTVSDTTHIVVLPQPATLLPADQALCGGETSFVLHGQQNAVNTWSTGVVADSITVTQNGTYSISSIGQNGCVTLDEINISFSDLYLEEINDTLICPGQTLVITPQTNASMVFGAGGLLTGPLVITESDTGNYFLYVIEGSCIKFTYFHVGLGGAGGNQNILPDSILVCSGQLPVLLNAGNAPFTSYLWNTNATTPSIWANASGWYSVTVNSGCGQNRDSTYLLVSPSPTVVLPYDTAAICPGESVLLNANAQYNNLWSTGSTANSINVSSSGTYWLQSTIAGCVARDTVEVIASPLVLEAIGNTGFCEDGNVTLEAVSNAGSFLWSTGQTLPEITVSQSGNYWVTATLGDCELTESFTVTEWPIPIFSLGNDITVPSGPVTIGVNNVFASYAWNVPGNTSNSLTVNTGGLYILTVTNAQGCTFTDSIRVHITAGLGNEDGSNVYLKIPQILSISQGPLMADYKGIKVNSITVYDATGKTVSMKNNFPTVWDGSSSNGSAATGIYYYTLDCVTETGKSFMHHGKVLLFD